MIDMHKVFKVFELSRVFKASKINPSKQISRTYHHHKSGEMMMMCFASPSSKSYFVKGSKDKAFEIFRDIK